MLIFSYWFDRKLVYQLNNRNVLSDLWTIEQWGRSDSYLLFGGWISWFINKCMILRNECLFYAFMILDTWTEQWYSVEYN